MQSLLPRLVPPSASAVWPLALASGNSGAESAAAVETDLVSGDFTVVALDADQKQGAFE
jgi:hypothetical protein